MTKLAKRKLFINTLKTLSVLLLLKSFTAASTHVDVGYKDEPIIKTTFHANGVIIDASKATDDKIGLGFGFQKQGMQIYAGAGYKTTEEIYVFTGLDWKNERHSIINARVDAIQEEYKFTLGYTYLVSDTFGFAVEYDTNGKTYVGFRKWI